MTTSDDYDNSDNPYAAPDQGGGYEQHDDGFGQKPLASRLQRLGSQLIDGLVGLVAVIPAGIGAVMLDPEINANPKPMGFVLVGIGVVMALALLGIQLYLLAKDGQTIGKKVGSCRIVDYHDGSHPGLGRIFLMRMLLPGIIGAIPCAGPIFSLVNILFIFGEEQRCIHDLMATTKVVQA